MLSKPHWVYWSLSLLAVMAGLMMGSRSFDVQLHDTYYVISLLHWDLLFAVLLGLCSSALVFLEKWGAKPSSNLILIQLFVSLFSLVLFHLAAYSIRPVLAGEYLRTYPRFKKIESLLTLSLLVFLFAQITFFLYLTFGLMKTFLKKAK